MVAKREVKVQCIAITKKGTRCKWNALPNEKVCHVHIKTNNVKKGNSKTQTRQEPKRAILDLPWLKVSDQIKGNKKEDTIGNIYVYTYGHMLHKTPIKTPYLHLAMPTENNWLDKRQTAIFDTSENILIKVGYTRKRPEVRVKEWREQCGHSDFVLLSPGFLVPEYNNQKKEREVMKFLLYANFSKNL